jgi:hypothetical protein
LPGPQYDAQDYPFQNGRSRESNQISAGERLCHFPGHQIRIQSYSGPVGEDWFFLQIFSNFILFSLLSGHLWVSIDWKLEKIYKDGLVCLKEKKERRKSWML